MADMNLTADVKIDKVDATAIAKALQFEFSKVSSSIGGKVAGITEAAEGGKGKEGPGVTGGTEITAVLQALFKDALNDLLKILQDVIKAILFLATIGIVLKVIADLIGAFWSGFKTLSKVWGSLLEVVTKMVEPFVNLLIPPLLPLIMMLSQVARILNLILMPLFNIMMKAFAGMGGVIGTAIEQLMGGDLVGAISTLVEGYASTLETMKADFMTYLQPLFDLLASWIRGFVSMDLTKIQKTLVDLLGEQLGNTVFGFIQALHWGISAILGFIANFTGQPAQFFTEEDQAKIEEARSKAMLAALESGESPVRASVIGQEAAQAKMKELNAGFEAGLGFGQMIMNIVDELGKFLTALKKDPAATLWTTLVTAITSLSDMVTGTLATLAFGEAGSMGGVEKQTKEGVEYENVGDAFEKAGLVGAINKLVEDISGINLLEIWVDVVQPGIKKLGDALDMARKKAFGEDGNGGLWKDFTDVMGDDEKGIIGELNKWLKALEPFSFEVEVIGAIKAAVNAFAAALASAASSIIGGGGGAGTPTPPGGTDFISRPGMGAVPFSPDDTIIGIKDAGALFAGGGGTTYNIYVSGNTDRQIVELVKEGIEKAAAESSRAGLFQKGY